MTAARTGTALTRITEEDIDAIAIGAAVLGTGGGGDPHVGALHAKRAIREHGPVPVIAVTDLDDDGIVAPVGMIGAPSVSIEKIAAAEELVAAIDLLEQGTGQRVAAIMPIEIGGGNSLIPIAAAAERGLPIVDGDAMGRAFPEAQMVTYHLAGLGPGATVLVDAQGNAVLSRPVNCAWSERLARVLSFEMGGSATMIDYAYPGSVVRDVAIPGTLSTARRIGELLLGSELRDEERIGRMLDELGGTRLFDGKVSEIERAVSGGFTRGRAILAGTGDDRGAGFELDFQNEMLLGRRDGVLAAVTPDLIAVLDQSTGHPITTETLRYGARVTVVAFPCHPQWRTEIGLATAGPQYFGYDVAYEPIEELALRAEEARA
ncbi:hypothetical protein XM48_12965 [Leucobacter sp. Ag1]|uniref:DUF917 domain-containing protein n=1 Tax=Leucobacter sp. Ag1 TaxID=1642040 RepID=UPI0006225032|nr:DUF917 domain-containing protein [Leucobacter sp. Ag1]KKI16910.1 hypothetical protein XM48_12965 [Leucobacter sp. Ag1]